MSIRLRCLHNITKMRCAKRPAYSYQWTCNKWYVPLVGLSNRLLRKLFGWRDAAGSLSCSYGGAQDKRVNNFKFPYNVKLMHYFRTGMNVYMGVYNPSTISSNVRSRVLCVRRNDNYNNSTLRNDIAILRLETPLIGSGILTGCLPSQGASFVGSTCVVAGWGKTNFTTQDAPTTLRQVFVPIVTMSQCVASYNNILGSNTQIYLDQQMEICAGGVQGIDACTVS